MLREFETSHEVRLTPAQRDQLRTAVPRLTVTPSIGRDHAYDVTPGAVIGAVDLGGLSVQIRPKLPIDRVLFLMTYAFDPAHWRDAPFDLDEQESLVEALIPGFVFHVKRALRRGVLQGYHQRDEALAGVKGRIQFDEQLRRHFGVAPPIELIYDDFTEDILPNRLLKAAALRLQNLNLRHEANRRDLRNLLRGLAPVTSVEFSPKSVPDVLYTRLNEHYRPAVELARLVLRSTSFDLGLGGAPGRSFIIDMNVVFEDFVIVALREALGLRRTTFPQGAVARPLFLDSARMVRLKPDLSWWVDGRPVFVGDVKYKRLDVDQYKHADLYQLLAYTIGTDLDDGLLIYAAGEAEGKTVTVPMAGKRLTITTLGLQGSPREVLREVGSIAALIRSLREHERLEVGGGR